MIFKLAIKFSKPDKNICVLYTNINAFFMYDRKIWRRKAQYPDIFYQSESTF